ncbi:hypothetical protein FXO37_17269 [Capsicum annuum]|nr:hypothetical protein FXO37_17269 [Capsicum annuum]
MKHLKKVVKLIVFEGSAENLWSWYEVKFHSKSLLMSLDPSLGPALMFFVMNVDKYRYVAAESFYKLVMEFSPVPDLYIMWPLHLCEAHQEMQSWAEAAQCVVTVAGVVMQVEQLEASFSHDTYDKLPYYPSVSSFGGSNINLSTWKDNKYPSESKRMEMDVCKERGGVNELETFYAEYLGFRLLQRFLRDQ